MQAPTRTTPAPAHAVAGQQGPPLVGPKREDLQKRSLSIDLNSALALDLDSPLILDLNPTRLCAGSNPHDTFQLMLALDGKDPLVGPKREALQKRSLGQRARFPLRIAGLPNSVVQFAAFIEAQPEDPSEVEQLAQYLLDKVRLCCCGVRGACLAVLHLQQRSQAAGAALVSLGCKSCMPGLYAALAAVSAAAAEDLTAAVAL